MKILLPKCVYASLLYLKKINKKNENKTYLPVCRQAGLLTVNVLDLVGKCVYALALFFFEGNKNNIYLPVYCKCFVSMEMIFKKNENKIYLPVYCKDLFE